MATSVIRNFIAKALFKKKGAIANKKAVEFSANALEQRLINIGIDPDSIRSEQELNQILNLVKQAEDQAFNQRFGNMLAGSRFDKPADVFNIEGQQLDPNKPIIGGTQTGKELSPELSNRLRGTNVERMKQKIADKKVENTTGSLMSVPNKKGLAGMEYDLPPPGSRGGPDDIAAPFQSSDESLKSMIEAENKAAAKRMRNKKMVKDAIDNMSPTFVKGDRKYNAQMIAEDLAEKKFGKEYYDLDQTQQLDLYDEALEGYDELTRGGMPDPEDFAQGGRAGFKFGLGPLKTLFDFANKKSPAKAYMDYLESIKTRMKAGKEAEVAGEVIPIAAGGALITNQLKKKLKAMNEEQKKEFKKEMEKKADGGRIGYDEGSKLTDFIDVQAAGSKSGKQQIEGAPEGITADRESIDAIIKADIPISQKIDLLAKYQYGKGRTKYERDGQEIFLDEGGAKNRDIGFGFNKDGEGIGGTLMYNMETGEPEFNIGIKKSFADGGRIGYFMGGPNPKGLGLLRQILNYSSKKGRELDKFKGADLSGLDMLRLSNPKTFNKFLEDARGKVNLKEGIMGTDAVRAQQKALKAQRKNITSASLDVAKDIKARDDIIAKKIAEEAKTTIIPKVKKQLMEGMGMSEEAAQEAAEGLARAASNIKPTSELPRVTDEGILQLENVLKNMETGGKKKRDLNATGGRIGFKDGMSRRTFLKLLGGLASIPIIGKIVKPIKLAKGVKNVPIIKTENVAGKPEWFDALVNKVIIEGDDVTKKFATAERQSIHQKTLDDGSVVRVTEDVDDGAVRVEYESEQNTFADTVQMEYKKPLPDEGAPDPAAEFSTAESGPVGRQTGPDDYDIDVDEVGGSSISDLDSDVSKLKEYATGQKLTMKEFIQSKKRRDRAKDISVDLEAQADAVTRRQGDYDPNPEEFMSGGIARMLGE